MSIIVFQHEPHEPASLLGDALLRHGHRLRTIRLDRGQAVPADLDDAEAVISMGGAANVDEQNRFPWMQPEMACLRAAHEAGLPLVGICLGAQLIAAALGGKVEHMDRPEVGWAPITIGFAGTTDPIFAGVAWTHPQFHMHGCHVTTLPPDATPLASSAACRHQAFKVGLRAYAFQFHFEWGASKIAEMGRSDFARRAGQTPQRIAADTAMHYDTYRRLGDRIRDNIATYLVPATAAI